MQCFKAVVADHEQLRGLSELPQFKVVIAQGIQEEIIRQAEAISAHGKRS